MNKKIVLGITILLFLFNSLNAFAATCGGTAYFLTTGWNCRDYATGVCTLYYAWCAVGMQKCVLAGDCTVPGGDTCTGICDVGDRQATSKCTNSPTGCAGDWYQTTGATDKFCKLTTTYNETEETFYYWCVAGPTCIPEFFGIEFGEMSISTGIIALVAAIALPTLLFRKKK